MSIRTPRRGMPLPAAEAGGGAPHRSGKLRWGTGWESPLNAAQSKMPIPETRTTHGFGDGLLICSRCPLRGFIEKAAIRCLILFHLPSPSYPPESQNETVCRKKILTTADEPMRVFDRLGFLWKAISIPRVNRQTTSESSHLKASDRPSMLADQRQTAPADGSDNSPDPGCQVELSPKQ